MIENVIEEGSAADKTVRLIQELEQGNFIEVAEVFRRINEDEIRHVTIGNKWARILLDDNEEKYYSLFESLSDAVNPDARRIESIKTRLASGFTKELIKKYF